MYLFINGTLVVDMGGTHSALHASVWLEEAYGEGLYVANSADETLDPTLIANASDKNGNGTISWAEYLGLEEGGIYSFDFFQMERNATASDFAIYTNIKVMNAAAVPGKTAYLNGTELAYGAMVPGNSEVEYGFSLTNTSSEVSMKVSNMP